MEKLILVRKYFERFRGASVAVAFSGGVDSAVVLKLACEVASEVHAVTIYTPLHSPAEPQEAAHLAHAIGSLHTVLQLEEIPDEITNNPVDRCYLCKKHVFTQIGGYAKEHGLAHIMDGTNAQDHTQYRPGLRALKELGVLSPLAEMGLCKDDVRAIAAALELSVSQKPSAPCLATRFPYNTPIDKAKLRAADEMEVFLRSKGFAGIRTRIHGDLVRIEAPAADLERLLAHRLEIAEYIKTKGYYYVTLDMEGFRSGSMDLPLGELTNGSL